jgi:hypothetical protein
MTGLWLLISKKGDRVVLMISQLMASETDGRIVLMISSDQGCQFRSVSSGMTETFHTNSKTKQNGIIFISFQISVRSRFFG